MGDKRVENYYNIVTNEKKKENKSIEYYKKKNIHMGYWIFILIVLSGCLFTRIGYANKNLSDLLSFAGTISGIILSILAIIITLIGEIKSDNTKDKLVSLSDNLEEIVFKIEETTNNLQSVVNSNKEVNTKLNSIENQFTKLNSKDNQFQPAAYKEAAIDSNENKTKQEFNNGIDNMFILMFEEGIKNLPASTSRELCLTFLYLDKKYQLGIDEVQLKDFIEDGNIMKLDIKEYEVAWAIEGVFHNGLVKNNDFKKYIYDYCENRYWKEVRIIKGMESSDIVQQKEIQNLGQ